MNVIAVKKYADRLFSDASFIAEIKNQEDHEKALKLIENLIDDFDENESLISVLCNSIERWEDHSPDFSSFNSQESGMKNGLAVFKTLIDQHNLGVNDFENEIGGKSMVSLILNEKRKLTLEHYYALAERFDLDPKVFV